MVTVPLTALFRDRDAWALFVNENGRAALRRVAVAHHDSIHAEIIKGLAAGEEVVLHPSDRVVGGVRIAAR